MTTEANTIAPLDTDEPLVSISEATPPPAAEAAPADPQPAEPGEGVSQDPEPPDDPPKAETTEPPKSNREKLISKLIGLEESPPAKEDPEPEPEKAKEPEPPKADEPPKTPEPPKDDDLKEVSNEDIKALKPGEARRKITRLITRVRESEPLAKGYKEIIDLCTENKMSPEDYRAWVALGIGVQQGNEKAIESFAALAGKLGITQPAAPALSPDLDTWLEAQTKDLEISATAAAELRKRLGVSATSPAPTRPAPTAPAPQRPAPQQPDPIIAARTASTVEINRIADEYEKRIGEANFKALEPKIMAELAKRKGRHPDSWPDIFRSVIETELAKAPKPAQVGGSLRPGGGTSPPAAPVFKSERERIIHKYAG